MFPCPEFASPATPVAVKIFWSSDGGRTMSRSWLGEVVFGYPIESRVSSRSYMVSNRSSSDKPGETCLVDNVEMISEGCR